MSQDKQHIDLEIKPDQVEYLQAMATKYALPDTGKAMRCLIDFARSEPEQERQIFEVVRCLGC